MSERSFETEAVHAGRDTARPKGKPSTVPIYTASTYEFEAMSDFDRVFGGELDDYVYVRHGNPTCRKRYAFSRGERPRGVLPLEWPHCMRAFSMRD
jgi:O-acetylhomoserine/O-acetylserine sulfhydrylase-like pyridoxal-dependent enzyme